MNPEENLPLHSESSEKKRPKSDNPSKNAEDIVDIPEIEAQIVEKSPNSEDESNWQEDSLDWWKNEPFLPIKEDNTETVEAVVITSLETLETEKAEALKEVQGKKQELESEIEQLNQQKVDLIKEIADLSDINQLSTLKTKLETEVNQLRTVIEQMTRETQELEAKQVEKIAEILANQTTQGKFTAKFDQIIDNGLQDLEQRRQALEISVEQLERRRERIREEMRTTFAGVSQDLAIRVQGFKEYLVGSLQDLVAAAEQLEFTRLEDDNWESAPPVSAYNTPSEPSQPQFAQQKFQDQTRQIEQLLDQYRTRPDYYGPPWQLRRTFEPIHADRVKKWFFSQGGRGAIPSMGSRLQNILIASAVISTLHQMYGDRSRVLILANVPERLGEWRRGLQDCLGISRSDFAPERGIGLLESPEALIQRADRLIEDKKVPLVIIDEAENEISLALLQFPLWLAFAPDPQQTSSYLY